MVVAANARLHASLLVKQAAVSQISSVKTLRKASNCEKRIKKCRRNRWHFFVIEFYEVKEEKINDSSVPFGWI